VAFNAKVTHLNSHATEISRDEMEMKDGTVLDRYSSPIVAKDGRCYGRVWIFRDITERRRLETQLFKSQKMETVGKLAGGIAHEFNSILTAIIGQCEFLLVELPAASPLTKSAMEIGNAASRAAALTRQLLAFGRKQLLQPETFDLNQVILGMEGIIRQLMGATVDTHITPTPNLRAVKADAGQIEQVIMNVAINGRDAMPNGGKLTLETANVTFDQGGAKGYSELRPGDYVMLAITDTGIGMSAEVQARLFEPFFSTKGIGQGVGLGLSTCYGIIKQSGGHISIYSELGGGTVVKIYLPQAGNAAKTMVKPMGPLILPRGTETILFG
jgi:signal transduction histidine kinase